MTNPRPRIRTVILMKGSYDCGLAAIATVLKAFAKPTRGLRRDLDLDGLRGLKWWLPDPITQGAYPWHILQALADRGLNGSVHFGAAAAIAAARDHHVLTLTWEWECWQPHWNVLTTGRGRLVLYDGCNPRHHFTAHDSQPLLGIAVCPDDA